MTCQFMMSTRRCSPGATYSTDSSTFPYALPRDTNTAVEKNIWNYLFTSVLINTWNAWKAILKQRDSDCPPPEFTDICDQLEIVIVEKLCFH